MTLEAPTSTSTSTGPADEPPDPPHPPRPVPAALQQWDDPQRALGWMITAVVTGVAIGTRFWALGFPHTRTSTRSTTPTEAQEMLRYGYEDNRGYMFIVHPPLGKWLIGCRSSVWRRTRRWAGGWRRRSPACSASC